VVSELTDDGGLFWRRAEINSGFACSLYLLEWEFAVGAADPSSIGSGQQQDMEPYGSWCVQRALQAGLSV